MPPGGQTNHQNWPNIELGLGIHLIRTHVQYENDPSKTEGARAMTREKVDDLTYTHTY